MTLPRTLTKKMLQHNNYVLKKSNVCLTLTKLNFSCVERKTVGTMLNKGHDGEYDIPDVTVTDDNIEYYVLLFIHNDGMVEVDCLLADKKGSPLKATYIKN